MWFLPVPRDSRSLTVTLAAYCFGLEFDVRFGHHDKHDTDELANDEHTEVDDDGKFAGGDSNEFTEFLCGGRVPAEHAQCTLPACHGNVPIPVDTLVASLIGGDASASGHGIAFQASIAATLFNLCFHYDFFIGRMKILTLLIPLHTEYSCQSGIHNCNYHTSRMSGEGTRYSKCISQKVNATICKYVRGVRVVISLWRGSVHSTSTSV